MPRASPLPLLLPLLLLAGVLAARAADVFVIADDNRTLALANDTADSDGEPIVRKKRTFGDIVFRGLADVLGYDVARKRPQVFAFPPPLPPVPGIDEPLRVSVNRAEAPLQAFPFAVLPVVTAPALVQASAPAPCGRAASAPPCQPQARPPPPPKPTQPPCPSPKALPTPRPKPKPKPKQQPPPCGSGRANPATPSPCAQAGPAPPSPKVDSNLERVTSNFRLDFNFNRGPATAAPTANDVDEQPADREQHQEQEQEQEPERQRAVTAAPVPIRPQAGMLPPEPPRNPRVYLDAFVVRNGVTQKVHTVDALRLDEHRADNDYLVYDDSDHPLEEQQEQQEDDDDDYDYIEESRERTKSVREFGTAVDQFWDQKKNKKKKMQPFDYRHVHFGDRDLADQFGDQHDESHQSLQIKEPSPDSRRQTLSPADEEEHEMTTTTQDPRRRLKPRVLPPTEKNPNQIDTVTVRVPPIYKDKRPKKLNERPERPNSGEETESRPYGYSYPSSGEVDRDADAQSENSEQVHQTEKPKRKRRRKNKRRTRSIYSQHYTAGDFDYYGKKLPISKEEEYFRGLTIPPPTKDADLARLELGNDTDGHFLDDHERLRDDSERIKTKSKNQGTKEEKDASETEDETEKSDERSENSERSRVDAERSGEKESADEEERTGEKERADEEERTDRLGPNARVRETAYQNNYVVAQNVQVDDSQPLVRTVKRKKPKIATRE